MRNCPGCQALRGNLGVLKIGIDGRILRILQLSSGDQALDHCTDSRTDLQYLQGPFRRGFWQ
jgi:hypothetical protein